MNSQTAKHLKLHLHTDISQLNKLLLILDSFTEPTPVTELKKRATSCGLRTAKNWNVSDTLRKSKGKAISVPGGWEITGAGREHLVVLGLRAVSLKSVELENMREIASKIPVTHTKLFVEEAITCLESGARRASVVLSWCGAMSVLHHHVMDNYKKEFNRAGSARFADKFVKINKVEQFWRIQESDQLQLFQDMGLIDKDVAKHLKESLNLRNSCAHPGQLSIGDKIVARHLEILTLNVFEKF